MCHGTQEPKGQFEIVSNFDHAVDVGFFDGAASSPVPSQESEDIVGLL